MVECAGIVKKTAEGQGTKEPAFHDFLEFVIGGEAARRHEEQVTLEVRALTCEMLPLIYLPTVEELLLKYMVVEGL